MSQHVAGLTVLPGAAGSVPVLVEPIPELSLVSLPVFLSPQLREWIEVVGQPGQPSSRLAICGHAFRIVAWREDCLLIEHRCCAT